MKVYQISFWVTIAISTFNLFAGYLHVGYRVIGLLCFPALIFVFISWHRSVFWLGTVYLSIYILLAAIGVIIKVPLLPMIIASATALASWDLYLFRHDIDCVIPEESKPALLRDHLSSLGFAIISGCFLAVTFSYLKFRLPFGLIVLFVLIMMVCLMFGVQVLNNKSH